MKKAQKSFNTGEWFLMSGSQTERNSTFVKNYSRHQINIYLLQYNFPRTLKMPRVEVIMTSFLPCGVTQCSPGRSIRNRPTCKLGNIRTISFQRNYKLLATANTLIKISEIRFGLFIVIRATGDKLSVLFVTVITIRSSTARRICFLKKADGDMLVCQQHCVLFQ